jgi:signal transduction histidine kinase
MERLSENLMHHLSTNTRFLRLSENISIILGASILLLLITLFIVMIVMAYLKRDLKHLSEKKLMESEFEKQLLQSQLETQEETLNKLSIEIHDNVGQLLNSTKLLIGLTQRSLAESPETLTLAEQTLGKAIQEIRMLSRSLNKEWLQQFQFMENLEAEVTRINAARNLQIHLMRPENISLKAETQIILFRIVQEIIQNVIKHAQAKNITITIKEHEPNITIDIFDDGIGFNVANTNKSIGMLNITRRTQLIGGTVNWESSLQKGTRVHILLPINLN